MRKSRQEYYKTKHSNMKLKENIFGDIVIYEEYLLAEYVKD